MKKRGKMLAAALAAVGAVSIIAGGCSGENKERLTVAETTAMIKETTADQSSAAPESQAAEAESQAETESVPQVTIDTETQERYADDGKTLLVEGSFDKVGIEGAGYEKVAAAVEQWSEEEKGLFAESMEALVKTQARRQKTAEMNLSPTAPARTWKLPVWMPMSSASATAPMTIPAVHTAITGILGPPLTHRRETACPWRIW